MAEDEVMAPVEGQQPAEELDAAGAVAGEAMNTDLPAADEDDLDFPDEVGKEVKLTDDGGLIKKIITPGEGWESPEKGDEVT
ncbi:hypothetical protein HYH03_019222, partial [Edaphochlamys debaryana]